MSNKESTRKFKVEEIVAAEYEYIAQTAFQAQEDRARVTTFYLVSVGSLFGAFWGTQNNPTEVTYWAFAGLFLFLSYFGIITVFQLVRLRLAWFESAKAMNQIKEYLITQNQDLKQAFRWTQDSLPAVYKPKSIAYYLAFQVAMLGTITFGMMLFYSGMAINPVLNSNFIFLAGVTIGGLLFFYYQMYLYRKGLTKKE